LNILALDTSSEYCSVALVHGDALDATEEHAGQRHSELILGMIDELLARHALEVRRLDGIAYGAGPGSFTGLRIACGVVQGLALAGGIPVVGIGTLLAMAERAPADRVVCCIDARMHEIYHAAYERRNGSWHAVQSPSVVRPREAPLPPGGTWFGAGNGYAVYRDILGARYAGPVDRFDSDLHARAEEIARLALPAFEQGLGMDAALALPLYVRDRVALKMHEQR
jgi:tRNA threonylcarbamoyladenosine biosynthesis protein TsaB